MGKNHIEINVIDPAASMQGIESKIMKEIAEEIHTKLENVINSL